MLHFAHKLAVRQQHFCANFRRHKQIVSFNGAKIKHNALLLKMSDFFSYVSNTKQRHSRPIALPKLSRLLTD